MDEKVKFQQEKIYSKNLQFFSKSTKIFMMINLLRIAQVTEEDSAQRNAEYNERFVGKDQRIQVIKKNRSIEMKNN